MHYYIVFVRRYFIGSFFARKHHSKLYLKVTISGLTQNKNIQVIFSFSVYGADVFAFGDL